MRILNTLPEASYKDFSNKNLTIEEILNGFSKAQMDFYSQKIALWQKLKSLLSTAGISSIAKKTGVLIEGVEITSLILGEALEYFCRAFCNFFAQDELMQHGYSTWSGVTNYYVSFFCVHSLLRLQGRAITSIWRPSGKRFYIFPYNFLDHQYVICSSARPAHEAAFITYYDVYDGFQYSENLKFEHIFKRKYVGQPDEESDFRNQINYEPYLGYEEIGDPNLIPEKIRQYGEKRFTSNEIEILASLTTDLDYRYYARAALRLIFSHILIEKIANRNNDLNSLLSSRKRDFRDFLRYVQPRIEEGMISRRLQTIMKLEDN